MGERKQMFIQLGWPLTRLSVGRHGRTWGRGKQMFIERGWPVTCLSVGRHRRTRGLGTVKTKQLSM
jgi:hypothetical protein